MEIKVCKMDDIPNKRGAKNNRIKEIESFIKSNQPCCEIFANDGEKLSVIYGSYNRTIERKEFPVKVIMRNRRVFLVRTDMED